MTHFARLDDGIAVEILPATVDVDGRAVPIAERYHPDFVAALVPAPPEVQPGWRLADDAWLPPEEP